MSSSPADEKFTIKTNLADSEEYARASTYSNHGKKPAKKTAKSFQVEKNVECRFGKKLMIFKEVSQCRVDARYAIHFSLGIYEETVHQSPISMLAMTFKARTVQPADSISNLYGI